MEQSWLECMEFRLKWKASSPWKYCKISRSIADITMIDCPQSINHSAKWKILLFTIWMMQIYRWQDQNFTRLQQNSLCSCTRRRIQPEVIIKTCMCRMYIKGQFAMLRLPTIVNLIQIYVKLTILLELLHFQMLSCWFCSFLISKYRCQNVVFWSSFS